MPENNQETVEVIIPRTGERVALRGAGEMTLPQIREELVRRGEFAPEDFVGADQSANSWWRDNIDIATGTVGSVIGGVIGARGGPAGIKVGSATGSGLFTAAGELIEDALDGKDLDYWNAVKEGGISFGIDLVGAQAFESIGNFIKSRRAAGFTPEETRQLFEGLEEPLTAGSEESLRMTQGLLNQGGATLTPYQAGARGTQTITQRIADLGFFSSAIGERNAQRANEVISQEVTRLLDDLPVSELGSDPEAVGMAIHGIIDAGRQAAGQAYETASNSLMKDLGNRTVNTRGLNQVLMRFVNKGNLPTGTEYSDATIQILKQALGGIEELPTLKASDLIRFQKVLMNRISEVGTFGNPGYNPTASSELAELSNVIRGAIGREINRLDPALAQRFSGINEAYSTALSGILPDINKGFITQANKGSYQGIGNVLSTTGNISQARQFIASAKEAFDLAKKEGVELPVGTWDEALAAIRTGFVQKLLPDVTQEGFDISNYRKLAAQWSTPANKKRLALIMGDKAPQFTQLLNMMAEASAKPGGNVFSLMFRSKEYQAAGQLLAAGALSTSAAGVAGAGAVLGLPIFLAKIAYNPRNVNKLLAFENTTFRNATAMEIAAGDLVFDLMTSLPDEDQAEVRAELERLQRVQLESIRQQQTQEREQRR